MLNPAQPEIREDDKRYTKRGLGGGAVSGVVMGASVTQGAVVGGVFGAPFGGLGAIPGAAVGAIAGFIVGLLGGGLSGRFVDHVVRKEIYEVLQNQIRLQEQINLILRTQQDSENERREVEELNAHLQKRAEEALSSVLSCDSATHNVLRMSIARTAPDKIVCPITQLIFRDPVTLKLREANGTFSYKTYERNAIINWKNTCQRNGQNFSDPLTRLTIVSDPQIVLTDEIKQEMVKQFLRRCPEHYPDQEERGRNDNSQRVVMSIL